MTNNEWCLINSDPAVFTELIREFGVKGLQVEELWNLDDDERWQELKPVHGLIFLFKCYAEDYASQKSDSKQTGTGTGEAIGQELVDNSDLFFAKQVIQNACATQAIMSILMNMRTDSEDAQLGEMLSEFKSFALALDPASRGLALTNMDRIRDVHNSFARPILFDNESLKERMRKDDDVYHFIAYMPVNGRLYEFDGIRNGAIDHGRIVLGTGGAAEAMDTVETGSTSGSQSQSQSQSQNKSVADANSNWLTFARPVLEARIKHIQSIKADELHFSLLAVCGDRRVMAERRIESLANELSLCTDELRAAQIANELGREQSLVKESCTVPALHSQADTAESTQLSWLLLNAAARNNVASIKRYLTVPFTKELIELEHDFCRGGNTLLLAACCAGSGETELVKYIVDELKADLEHVGKVERKDTYVKEHDASALWAAAHCGNVNVVRFLLDRGAQVNRPTRTGSTPLLAACESHSLASVRYIVERGANTNAADMHGRTALMLASYHGLLDIVKYLVRHAGANVNQVCHLGRSALHYGVSLSHKPFNDVVKFLLKHGALPAPDNDGITPQLISALYPSPKILEYFLEAKRRKGKGFLLSQGEKADALELQGCTLVDLGERSTANYLRNAIGLSLNNSRNRSTDVNTDYIQRGTALWLRAERIRQRWNQTAPDYEAECVELVSTLRKFIPDLPSVALICKRSDNAADDRAIVENYIQFTRRDFIYLHSFIRRDRIVGIHGDSIERILEQAKKQTGQCRLELIRYALVCALKYEARKGDRMACSFPIQLIPTTDEHSHVLLKIISHLNMGLTNHNSNKDTFDVVSLVELAVDQVEQMATAKSYAPGRQQELMKRKNVQDNLRYSLILSSIVVLCSMALRELTRVRLDGNDWSSSTQESAHALSLLRLVRAMKRVCRLGLRGAENFTLLHIAVLSPRTLKAFLVKSPELLSSVGLNFLAGTNHGGDMLYSDFHSELQNCSTIELLLRCGADANARDQYGNTALHLLAQQLVFYATQSHGDFVHLCNSHCNHCDIHHNVGDSGEQLVGNECKIFDTLVESALEYSVLKSAVRQAINVSSDVSCFTQRDWNCTRGSVDEKQREKGNLQPERKKDNACAQTASRQNNAKTEENYDSISISTSGTTNALLDSDSILDNSTETLQTGGVEQLRMDSTRLRVYLRTAAALRTLLAFAHADVRNAKGKTYFDILYGAHRYLLVKAEVMTRHAKAVDSLQCLCARLIRNEKLYYERYVPARLADFINLH